MNSETYLNHPNFGLLYQVCVVGESKELFATLYAQRLFFVVTNGVDGVRFDPVSRTDARLQVESRLRQLRRNAPSKDYDHLQAIYKRTFQS